VRYKLGATIPLNYETVRPGAYFIKVLNETFINFKSGESEFDQNRFVVAGGHQFTPTSNFQLGLLWQKRSSEDLDYTHEPHTGFWRRFGISFMSIWRIESPL
jgi:hypothetical protein